MISNLKGRVAYIFSGENFDVDEIVGIQNLAASSDPAKLVPLMMKEFDPDFTQKVRPGDVIVGGVNFGYGHPHYPAMETMRRLGIAGVIAESFAPTFWSIEIAAGFPLISCPGILGLVDRWDELAVDWDAKTLENRTRGRSLPIGSMSRRDLGILNAGGVVAHLKREMGLDPTADSHRISRIKTGDMS
ncbi:MAG: 3-isopropylmalate dehydratase [Ottowia sp.]|uniref:3-isopropylmalate dehydratase n=1 Tax=Ottowia sp. TaxID=1898956 RepID=UPI003C772F5B